MNKKIINFLTKIFSHAGIRIYSENLFFLSLEKIVRILVGFFVGVYVARVLTPKYYGIFNYVFSYVTIFTIFSLPFLNNIALREMAKDEKNCGKALGTLRYLRGISSLLMLLLIFISTYIIPMENSVRILIWILSIGAFFAGADYFSIYFNFKRQNRTIALTSLIIFLFISALRVYFAWRNFPLIDFIILEALFLVALFCCLGVIFHRQIDFKLENDKIEREKYIQAGKILFFSTLFNLIAAKSELIVLKELTTENELGIFSVATRIIETFSFITLSFGTTFFPSIANSKNVSETLYNHRLKLYSGALFYVNLCCCIAIIIMSPIFTKLYGSNYHGIAPLIILCAFRLPLFGVLTPFTQHLYIENKIKYLTLFSFANMIFTIIFLIFATKKFGLQGAALSIVAVQAVCLFILPLFCKEKELAKLLISSILYFPSEIYKKIMQFFR